MRINESDALIGIAALGGRFVSLYNKVYNIRFDSQNVFI